MRKKINEECLGFEFKIYPEQEKKYKKWLAEQNQKAIEIQKDKFARGMKDYDDLAIYEMCWQSGWPYCGAVGGELTWKIVPTSIGNIVTVTHSVTGEECDLTDEGNFG
jgi:hypothetical protein